MSYGNPPGYGGYGQQPPGGGGGRPAPGGGRDGGGGYGGGYGGAPYGAPQQPYGAGYTMPPPNYLAWAIISIFIFWPLAIPAIIFANQVNQKFQLGDFAG